MVSQKIQNGSQKKKKKWKSVYNNYLYTNIIKNTLKLQ